MSRKPQPLGHAFSSLFGKPYVCRSCLSKQRAWHRQQVSHSTPLRSSIGTLPQKRLASTVASVTAVNAKREILKNAEKLYHAVSALEHDAGTYVDLSQLRLALRGLGSENPVTRVASMYKPHIARCRSLIGGSSWSGGPSWCCKTCAGTAR